MVGCRGGSRYFEGGFPLMFFDDIWSILPKFHFMFFGTNSKIDITIYICMYVHIHTYLCEPQRSRISRNRTHMLRRALLLATSGTRPGPSDQFMHAGSPKACLGCGGTGQAGADISRPLAAPGPAKAAFLILSNLRLQWLNARFLIRPS